MPNQEQLIKDPDRGENCNMKEVSSEFPIHVSEKEDSPHGTHRPTKVLRLRGGAGETKNHEAKETPGCPETSIFSS